MKTKDKTSIEKIRLLALSLTDSYKSMTSEEIDDEFAEVFSDSESLIEGMIADIKDIIVSNKKEKLELAKKRLIESKKQPKEAKMRVSIEQLKENIKGMLNTNEGLKDLTLAFRNQNFDSFDDMSEEELQSIWEDLNDLISGNRSESKDK